MYSVKGAGSNRASFYDDNLRAEHERKKTLNADLQRAIDNDEFFAVYQPIMDGSSNRIKAFEALIRWQHPTLGLIYPIEFIDLLEHTGLIVKVGEWILRQSCLQLKAWQTLFDPSLQMAINVSPRQFQDEGFREKVADALVCAKLNPGDLELEITENLLMNDINKAVATLEHLKEMGVVISMDDFGTGYSQFLYLIDFPIDILKIDRSIVSALGTQKGETITKTLLTMAQGLDLIVVAEGIENTVQQSFLVDNLCDRLQGYFFAKPMNKELCETWIQSRMTTQTLPPKVVRI